MIGEKLATYLSSSGVLFDMLKNGKIFLSPQNLSQLTSINKYHLIHNAEKTQVSKAYAYLKIKIVHNLIHRRNCNFFTIFLFNLLSSIPL